VASVRLRESLGLAIRCALNRLGTPTFNMPHILIDEGFCRFDEANSAHIEECLERLLTLGGFRTVLLCTHLDPVRLPPPHRNHAREGRFGSQVASGACYAREQCIRGRVATTHQPCLP
jgi:hypothetical protein